MRIGAAFFRLNCGTDAKIKTREFYTEFAEGHRATEEQRTEGAP
jgi:hypothetical protein